MKALKRFDMVSYTRRVPKTNGERNKAVKKTGNVHPMVEHIENIMARKRKHPRVDFFIYTCPECSFEHGYQSLRCSSCNAVMPESSKKKHIRRSDNGQ